VGIESGGEDGGRDSDIRDPYNHPGARTEHTGALGLMARNRTIHLPVWCKFLHPPAKCLQGAELRVTIQMVPNLLTKR